MPALRKVAVVAVPVIALAAAAVVLLFTVFRPGPPAEADLAQVLASLDASIRGGYLTTAADAIASIRELPRAGADQLRLLKRAWQVSAGSGNYTVLANLAARLPISTAKFVPRSQG